MRVRLQSTLVVLLALLCGCSLIRRTPRPLDPLDLHQRALVADLHSDTPLRMVRGFDLGVFNEDGDMDLPRLALGGIDLQVFACFVATDAPADSCRLRVDTLIDTLEAQIARAPERIAVCRSAAEARRIMGEGRIAAFLGVENGVAIENDLTNLDHFYNRDVRYLTLTHTASSDWCISSADTTPAFAGLTEFGRQVVRRMNEIGMIVDVSHASPEAVDAVLEISDDPIIASHSCAYSLCGHNRNLTDDQIRAIARGGGMIGINFYRSYLSDERRLRGDALWAQRQATIDSLKAAHDDDRAAYRKALQPLKTEVREALESIAVDVRTVVDHIDHVVALVGPDHVGLGSDFDGVSALPTGLEDCTGVPAITAELVRRGYKEEEILKILGGNFLRIFERVCDS